jgi:SNF2 family DNA or RNA helicase
MDYRLKPYDHQLQGINALIQNPFFALFDEMGVGKTKQVIDAAQTLFQAGTINKVIVVAPAAVRSVWYDQDFGELSKHLHYNINSLIVQYHATIKNWSWGEKENALIWLVTNYDFIRKKHRLEPLLTVTNEKTLLVLDESSAIKSHKSHQTKSCFKLREKAGRAILLNGTPIANSPMDMYTQGNMIDRSILNCSTIYHYKARYAVMGGYKGKQAVDWHDLDDLQERFKPYVLRRLKKDCLDLPPKLPPVVLSVPLSTKTWNLYKEMREEMITYLTDSHACTATISLVKALRLSQLTTGFLGGVEEVIRGGADHLVLPTTEEVSNEKLMFFLNWYQTRLEEDPNFKLLVWCRFTRELRRVVTSIDSLSYEKRLGIEIGSICGGQKQIERDAAIKLLDPRTMPKGPAVVVGNPAAGGMGLNLTGSHTVFRMSKDYNLKTVLQAADRVHRPGQVNPVSYFDLVATGPNGQKTIDHDIHRALNNKEDVAHRTTKAWIATLKDEMVIKEGTQKELF